PLPQPAPNAAATSGIDPPCLDIRMRIVFPSPAGDPGDVVPFLIPCVAPLVRVTAMNSTAVSMKHMIGLVCVVVVLVFGVTYTSMMLGNSGKGGGPGPTPV